MKSEAQYFTYICLYLYSNLYIVYSTGKVKAGGLYILFHDINIDDLSLKFKDIHVKNYIFYFHDIVPSPGGGHSFFYYPLKSSNKKRASLYPNRAT